MVEKLEVALLGNPELRLAGQPLGRFRSAKVYALFYYLAVTRRAQARTVLAGLFWGDIDEYYARRNLNRTLSDLVQFVGDHLTVERQSLSLARHQPYWLDVEVLEAATTTVLTAQTVTTLAAAADLYRGDFLDGFYVQDAPEFEQWVLVERTRLRMAALQLLHTLADYHAGQGHLSQAMTYARRILQLEPWREEAHCQLMLWLAQSGQSSAALAQFELCRQALRSELDVEPDAATRDLVARIRAGKIDRVTGDRVTSDRVTMNHPITQSANHQVTLSPPHLVTLSVPHNLPAQRTSFVGRTAELTDITQMLLQDDDCRLLTLIGPGGMGKTRLAIRAAEQIVTAPGGQARFADGVFFLPLEHVGDAQGIVSTLIATIAEESGFPLRADAPLPEQLLHFLRNRRMLLVLDNFEHLIAHADLCSTLLAAPQVKILVTSREALTLQEAWFYPLPGLSFAHAPVEQALAPNLAQPDEFDAVRLFIQCARRAQPTFDITTERTHVLRICTLVEGMPLGIELAAAWLKVMACAQIAEQMAHGMDILTARYQNTPPRHRSMRVVMEQSWALLTEAEQQVLKRLAIFRGPFRQEAASHVTGAALFTLVTLAEKALLRVAANGYYQLHELTRQYAEEQIDNTAKAALRDAHATFYAGLLHQQQPRLFTSEYRQVWETVGNELDNIRHAWGWLIECVGAGRTDLPLPSFLCQMAEVLTTYHLYHLLWLAGQTIFDQACQVLEAAKWASASEPTPSQFSRRAALLKLQISAGQFPMEMGHYRASLVAAERLLPICRQLGLDDDLFRTLLLYGHTQIRRGARSEAIPAFTEALALAQQMPLPRYRSEALNGLGMIASAEGRYSDAHEYYRQALAICREMGYRPWMARLLTNIGATYSRQEDQQQAQPYFEQARQIAEEVGDQFTVMINTGNLGGVQRGLEQLQSALDYYQRALAAARSMGEERWITTNLNGLADTYLGMANPAAAEQALHKAISVGHRIDSKPDTLNSVGLMGHLFARRGQIEAALKVLLFVEQHPATLARDRAYNQLLLAELRSELPALVLQQAEAWVATQTLDDLVRWLLYGPL